MTQLIILDRGAVQCILQGADFRLAFRQLALQLGRLSGSLADLLLVRHHALQQRFAMGDRTGQLPGGITEAALQRGNALLAGQQGALQFVLFEQGLRHAARECSGRGMLLFELLLRSQQLGLQRLALLAQLLGRSPLLRQLPMQFATRTLLLLQLILQLLPAGQPSQAFLGEAVTIPRHGLAVDQQVRMV